MDNELRKLKEIVQSCNINLLIGAGVSTPYLPLLGYIEKKLDTLYEHFYESYEDANTSVYVMAG